MVSTVNPKANETPSKPIPTFGNAAASTALPHPPNTSQNVPMDSARALFGKLIMIFSSFNGTAHRRAEPELHLPSSAAGCQGHGIHHVGRVHYIVRGTKAN